MVYGPSFGQWLKQRRRAIDLTQADLASYVGCSVDTIYRFESGARRPSKQVALRLASVLNVDDDEREAFLRLARSSSHDAPEGGAVGVIHERVARQRGMVPAPPTPLVERATEVAEMCAQLRRPHVRLITIVGLAGVGKTRLSLHVANELGELFADGVYFVALDTISDPCLVASAIARALGVAEQNNANVEEQLHAFLADRDILLVLDNFEQVLDGATLIADLLRSCPQLKVLATSRERLRLWAEWVWDLEGLRYPAADDAPDLLAYGSVQLFVQRASQVVHSWQLDDSNATAVARICRLVEGLPLAIELAAAAVRERDCERIADDIEANGVLPVATARDLPERHRSIWTALQHSWRLLTRDERRALLRCAVFRGGWTEDAAIAVMGATPQTLAALVERSLVRRASQPDGGCRYSFHAVIQQYVEKKAVGSADLDTARRHHLNYFHDLVRAGERELIGPHQAVWSSRIEHEQDNIRAALHWALDHDTGKALTMAASLTRFWYMRGFWQEGRMWLTTVLERFDPTTQTMPYARALLSLATLARCQNDYDLAFQHYERCLHIFEALGDDFQCGLTYQGMAEAASNQRDYAQAQAWYRRSLELVRPSGDHLAIGHSLAGLGETHLMHVELDCAAALFDESLAHFRRTGDQGSVASSLTFASAIARRRGDLDGARSLATEAIQLCRGLGHTNGISWALRTLGTLELLVGNLESAERLFAESLDLRWELRDKQGVAWVLEGFAEIACVRQQPQRVARLLGKAAALRAEVGAPIIDNERAELDRCIDRARAMLDAETWNALWETGARLRAEDAVTYALSYDEEG